MNKPRVNFDSPPTWLAIFCFCLAGVLAGCQSTPKAGVLKTRNVFLITTDGLRWQEVFTGAEEALLDDKTATGNPERMKQLFWKPTPEERRKQLMPFFWGEI